MLLGEGVREGVGAVHHNKNPQYVFVRARSWAAAEPHRCLGDSSDGGIIMTLNNHMYFGPKFLSFCLIGALSLAAAACGGGLSHTVDDGSLTDAQRKQLSEQDSALAKADGEVDKRAEEEAAAGNRVDAAKAEVEKQKKALAVAEAKLNVEEAKAEAAEARKEEAEKAAIVAQAKRELKKLKAVGPSGEESKADYKEKVAEFEKQVADALAAHAEAKIEAANKERDIEEAKQELAGLQ